MMAKKRDMEQIEKMISLREFCMLLPDVVVKTYQVGIQPLDNAHISECNICKFEEYNAEEFKAIEQQSIGTTKRH